MNPEWRTAIVLLIPEQIPTKATVKTILAEWSNYRVTELPTDDQLGFDRLLQLLQKRSKAIGFNLDEVIGELSTLLEYWLLLDYLLNGLSVEAISSTRQQQEH